MLDIMPSLALAPICDDSQQDHMVSVSQLLFLRIHVSGSLHNSLKHQKVQRKTRGMQSWDSGGDTGSFFFPFYLVVENYLHHLVVNS